MPCCCTNSVSPADILEWSEMKQFRKMMESTRKLTIADYIDEESLFALLRPTPGGLAPCKLLDGEWLLRRAETLSQCTAPEQRKSLALPRRQDLERDSPEAFMSVSMLRRLERGDARISSPLPLVCVSHIWRQLDHPDPYGDNLLVLADSFTKARKVDRFPSGDFAVFLDWTSLHQRDQSGARTPAEQDAFRHALSKMNLWLVPLMCLNSPCAPLPLNALSTLCTHEALHAVHSTLCTWMPLCALGCPPLCAPFTSLRSPARCCDLQVCAHEDNRLSAHLNAQGLAC